jgi:hypothetical protein
MNKRQLLIALTVTAFLLGFSAVGLAIAIRASHRPAITVTSVATVTTSAMPEASAFESCSTYLSGGTVSVEFIGPGASHVCSTWISRWSARGDFWTNQPPNDSNSGEPVCSMAESDLVATVYDDGTATTGRYLCSRFASDGWTETP